MTSRNIALTLFLVVALGGRLGMADSAKSADFQTSTIDPVRVLKKLRQEPKGMKFHPFETNTVKLIKAKVVVADYALIRKDFYWIDYMSDEQIDRWLIDNVAYIAETQYRLGEIGDQPSSSGLRENVQESKQKIAYRPKDYGRALVFPVFDEWDSEGPIGFIDVKGSGAVNPKLGGHSNGLASLREGIREFIYEKLVSQVFFHYNQQMKPQNPFRTIGTYAVIDPGFYSIDVRVKSTSNSPARVRAGLILRQAHRRSGMLHGFVPFDKAREVEKVLLRYGLSSRHLNDEDRSGKKRSTPYWFLDIQGTEEGDVIDFGTFHRLNAEDLREDIKARRPTNMCSFQDLEWQCDSSSGPLGKVVLDYAEVMKKESLPLPQLYVPAGIWDYYPLQNGISKHLTRDFQGNWSSDELGSWIKSILADTREGWRAASTESELPCSRCEELWNWWFRPSQQVN